MRCDHKTCVVRLIIIDNRHNQGDSCAGRWRLGAASRQDWGPSGRSILKHEGRGMGLGGRGGLPILRTTKKRRPHTFAPKPCLLRMLSTRPAFCTQMLLLQHKARTYGCNCISKLTHSNADANYVVTTRAFHQTILKQKTVYDRSKVTTFPVKVERAITVSRISNR